MHHTIRRWSPRHSYVLLAFILIIIVLVLAGCGSFNRVQEEKGTLTAETVADVPGAVVDARQRLDHPQGDHRRWCWRSCRLDYRPSDGLQALTNLIGNAVQHGSAGAPVYITARGDADPVTNRGA